MGKKSKQIGKDNQTQEKKEMIKSKILELSDEEIEKLFEDGKITQNEYEAIINYRKQKKKKTDKEKFEERIRCNNSIIQKIITLGRKFKKQEQAMQDLNLDKDKVLNRDERIRTKSKVKSRDER